MPHRYNPRHSTRALMGFIIPLRCPSHTNQSSQDMTLMIGAVWGDVERLVACSFPLTDNDLIPDWSESCCHSISANRQTQRLEQCLSHTKMMTFFGPLNNYVSLSFVIKKLIIYGKLFNHNITFLDTYLLQNCKLLHD